MKKRIIYLITFICSAVCFGIRSKLIYNTGYFCDEYNVSPADIYGGDLYLALDWAEWVLLAILCIIMLICFIVSVKNAKK